MMSRDVVAVRVLELNGDVLLLMSVAAMES
jgi:hypothetical protein